jgi:hypothetical protein
VVAEEEETVADSTTVTVETDRQETTLTIKPIDNF